MLAPLSAVTPAPRLVAWLLALSLSAAAVAQDRAAAPSALPPAAVAVQAAPLSSVWVFPERQAAATVVPRNRTTLVAEVAGVVSRWGVDVGTQVRSGQELARLDDADLQLARREARAALDAASARLKLSQAQLRRAQELTRQGFYSGEALSQREAEGQLAQAELNGARARADVVQRQLGKAIIRAPFAGVVEQRLLQRGAAVQPGSPLFVLSERGAEEVETQLSSADARSLAQAGSIAFTPEHGDAIVLRVKRVQGTLDAASRTQRVRLLAVDADAQLVAGGNGTLRWQDPQPHAPLHLLVRRTGQQGLFVVDEAEGRAVARFVPLPAAQEGRAAPLSLPAETRVVTQGQAALQHGTPLRLLP